MKKLNANKNINAIITTKELVDDSFDYALATSLNPIESYYKIHMHLLQNTDHFGEKFETQIGAGCAISDNVKIPLRNVKIGNDCYIGDSVTIYENSVIVYNVRIESG